MFRLVVLPDFQHYNDIRLGLAQKLFQMPDQQAVLEAQVRWVAENAQRLQVALAVQEGDLTQSNDPREWEVASRAMAPLDAVLPYVLCVGNHDMGYDSKPEAGRFWASNRRDSLLDRYFPPSRFQGNPLYQYGGNLDGSSENYYLLLDTDDESLLVISLEFLPRDEVLDWANDVVRDHRGRQTIVLTHGFLDVRGKRNLRAGAYGIEGNDGPEIWSKFVARHSNIFLLLCGHDYGEARRTDRGIHGNPVHQVLANYQWWEKGGNGWLRLLTFDRAAGVIRFETYSPVLDQYRRTPSSHFEVEFPQRTERRWPCLSYLQRRKLYHFFSLLDADGSGELRVNDLGLIVERFINIKGLHPDNPSCRVLSDELSRFWSLIHAQQSSGSDAITFETFADHWNRVVDFATRTGATDSSLRALSDALFEAIDVNRDGYIGAIEFWLFRKAMGIDHGHMNAFRALDRDKDANVDKNELAAAMAEFFIGDDADAAANELFGPLPT